MPWVEQLPSKRWRGGYIDALGRKRQKGGFLHKSAAKQWAEDGEEAALRGLTYDARDGRTLFGEWAERWWEARKVELSTAERERHRYKAIHDYWGDTPIAAIGSLEVQAWVKELAGNRAPATVRKYHNMLSVILSAAILPPHRLILENPCRHVTLPALPQGRETYLTVEQVDALDAELSPPASTLVWTLAYTGMRWGECVGLHVNRIDWLRRSVTVVDVIGQADGGFHHKPYPKGRKQRHVSVPDHVLERLSQHVKDFPPIDCGLHSDCAGLVFWSTPRYASQGGPCPVQRQTFSRWTFKPAVRAAGLPVGTRLHDLRHSNASWLVQAGVPLREVQERLGHSSITTTERYGHLAPDVGDHSRNVLERGNQRGNGSSATTH